MDKRAILDFCIVVAFIIFLMSILMVLACCILSKIQLGQYEMIFLYKLNAVKQVLYL